MPPRAVLAVALAAAACFSEAPPVADESTTGDGPCAIGSEGCFCTEGNGCDNGLECLLPAGVCVGQGCSLGSGLCGCDQGACADGYKCVEDFCAPEDSATISDTGSADDPTADATASSGMEGTSTSGFTTLDTVTNEDGTLVTDASVTEATLTDSTAESSTTAAQPQTCDECLTAVQLDDCAVQWAACTSCEPWAECFSSRLDSCCQEAQPPTQWAFFATCADPLCTELCGSIQCEPI